MPRSKFMNRAAAVAAGCLAMAAPLTHAQRTAIDLRSSGLFEFLPSEKDAGVARALRMLDDRFAELTDELDLDREGEAGFELAHALLTGAYQIRIDLGDDGSFGGLISLRPPASDVDALRDGLAMVLREADLPLERADDGSLSIFTPLGEARIGVLDDRRGDCLVVTLGQTRPAAPASPEDGLLPEGRAVKSGRIDLGAFGPFLGFAAQQAGPEAAGLLGELGLVGENAMRIHYGFGHTEDQAVFRLRLTDVKSGWQSLGLFDAGTLSRADLRAVPIDATAAQAVALDLGFVSEVFDRAEAFLGVDPLAPVESQLGIDLREDVIEQIAGPLLWYMSRSTGNGLTPSTIGLVGLRDADAFAETHERLRQQANGFGRDVARGYAKIRELEFDDYGVDAEGFSLIFPGLPVPFEPSWAIVEGNVMIGLSPYSLASGIDQALDPDRSVLNNPDFRGAFGRDLDRERLLGVEFYDTEFFARRGAPYLPFVASGIANAVRSPSADREPPAILPLQRRLLEGVEPVATATMWDGGDLVSDSRFDRSFLVNLTMFLQPEGLAQLAASFGQIGASLPAFEDAADEFEFDDNGPDFD